MGKTEGSGLGGLGWETERCCCAWLFEFFEFLSFVLLFWHLTMSSSHRSLFPIQARVRVACLARPGLNGNNEAPKCDS